MSVTIGFFSNDSLFCRAIQLVTGSNINHAAIGFVKDGKPMWLQASVNDVSIVDRGWLEGLTEEYEILIDVENEVEMCEKKVGEKYAFVALLGFLFMIVLGWFGIKISNPIPEPSCAFCSELVVEMDVNHLIPEFAGLRPEDISPAALRNICANGKSFKKIYPNN